MIDADCDDLDAPIEGAPGLTMRKLLPGVSGPGEDCDGTCFQNGNDCDDVALSGTMPWDDEDCNP